MIFYKIALILSMTIIAGCQVITEADIRSGKFQVGQCINQKVHKDNSCLAKILEKDSDDYFIVLVTEGCRGSYGDAQWLKKVRVDEIFKVARCPNL